MKKGEKELDTNDRFLMLKMVRVIIVYSLGKPDNHQPDSKHREFNTVTALRAHGSSNPSPSLLSPHLPILL